MTEKLVICCSEIDSATWRWVAPYFPDLTWEFVACKSRFGRGLQNFVNLGRLSAALKSVRLARRNKGAVLVTHGPTLAAWCALFARLLGVDVPILAHSFNFVALPGRLKLVVFRFALARVRHFVVFSQVEREVYAAAFHLPIERFEFLHWSVQPPAVASPDDPVEAGNYVAAIGGNARDYPTLIEAARELPDVRFVLVVRPENLAGLKVPQNMSVHCNIGFGEAMNILYHARFMALPLNDAQVPCGHVTLVAAMHLGKAMVVTDSRGVRDYVFDGENALLVEPKSPAALAAAIRRLWDDREFCGRLAEHGRLFAAKSCTEGQVAVQFGGFLHELVAGRPQ